ncbi:MAG: hypothetical protein ACPGTO_01540 [Polaribacter sp.]
MIRKTILVFLLITSFSSFAQRTNSSPYSFFGIGEEFGSRTVEQNSMGGVGVAFSHYKYLNFTNPAAYADLKYTTYAFGLLHNDLTVKDATEKQNATSTSLSYFALAFPLGKKAGVFVGAQPISSIGYSLINRVYDVDDPDAVTEITLFSGDGGVNKFHGGFGAKIFEGLSLGIEANFSFGKVDNSVINQRANVSLATKYNETSTIVGGSITVGAQYKEELEEGLLLNLGMAIKLENNLKVEGNDYLYSFSYGGGGVEVPRDTIASGTISGNYILPAKTTVGAGLGKFDKWYAGIEYETQEAIKTTGFLSNTNAAYNYGASNRISFGGFYIPKINSISSYWDRITYRAGVRLQKTGLLVDGSGSATNFTSIDDFGISFGLGLPLGNRYSNVNLGFELGKKGTTDNNLIEENYFNFRLSLSLTDINWFIKRKID